MKSGEDQQPVAYTDDAASWLTQEIQKCTGSHLLLFTSVSIAAQSPLRPMTGACHAGLRFPA